uniref:AMPK1_CBM domain-containing protein n=1 Tax=Caenorhabditis japonica TaxID=281687 RepID=A0A8R1HZA2_CAEJA
MFRRKVRQFFFRITAVLIGVLSLYYTLESIVRSIRRFFVNALREPQSTVSTPRCLSPVKSTLNNDKISPDILASPPVRQKVAMNEPVNCVFIRPSNLRTPISDSPKISVPKLHSMMSEEDPHEPDSMLVTPEDEPKKKTPQTPQRLEDAQFTAGSNINIRPTLSSPKISTNTTQPSRKSGGIDQEREVSPVPTKSSLSVNEQLEEWMQKQISGVQRLESRSIAGRGSERVAERLEPSDSVDSHVVSSNFMAKIQELIQAQLNLTTIKTESSNENISEMSTVPPSTNPALSVEEISITDSSERSPNEFTKGLGKQLNADEEEADIVIDDNHLFAESENQCSGSVLVSNGPQKVLFRWTDERPDCVDSVTVTGSFFGWKMNLPMRRSSEKTFEVCLELPDGTHDYLISIYRFD